MYDPTSKVSLPAYLRDLERRIAERERANPIARASFHDGTRTRGGLGKFAHPGGGEQTGAVFYDAAGDVLLLADDTALTLSKTAITGSTAVAADGADYVLISDSSDSANLKKALISSISAGGGTGDMLAATYDPQTIAADAFDRANHTGTQTASTVSDFDTTVSNNAVVTGHTSSIAANALTIFNLGSDVAAHHSRLAGIDAVQTTQNADIVSLEGEQTTQDSAIALNTAKVGITTAQANEITANTAKVGITTAQANEITANTAKVSYNVDGAGANSVLIKGTAAAGGQAVAVGSASSAAGTQAVAIGYQANAAGYISVALGRLTSSSQNYGVSVGYGSDSSGLQAITVGRQANASGTNSTAIGYLAEATASGSVAIGTGVVASTASTTSVDNLEVQGDLVVLGNRNGGPILATATIDTSNNLNDGTTARRSITASSLGTNWSIATNALTYSGTPSAVHIEVNVSYTSTGVRASPVVELWKGTTKLAMAHTGYMRNTNGHNEASSNFTFIDTAPGTNPAYHLESSRGSVRTEAATPLAPSQFAAYVFA